MPRLVAAPDKMRGTLTAAEVAAVVARAAEARGWHTDMAPMSDGGEGFLEVMPGARRTARVSGPLGSPVDVEWKLDGRTAYIESALASGLQLAGGAEANDPIAATSAGTGELILAAIGAGARKVVVGAGGVASTDGGMAAAQVLGVRSRSIDLVVACDVQSHFLDAARTFAAQKGASPSQVGLLERRLERLVQVFQDNYGVDVSQLAGSGAAGGLAGGLAAGAGARLVSGFDLVAEQTGLADLVEGADLVVTAEGFVDAESFNGKVVGGVAEMAKAEQVPLVVLAGEVYDEVPVPVLSLVDRFGSDRAWADPEGCITAFLLEALADG